MPVCRNHARLGILHILVEHPAVLANRVINAVLEVLIAELVGADVVAKLHVAEVIQLDKGALHPILRQGLGVVPHNGDHGWMLCCQGICAKRAGSGTAAKSGVSAELGV